MLNALLVGMGARGRDMLRLGIFASPAWRIVAAVEPLESARQRTAVMTTAMN